MGSFRIMAQLKHLFRNQVTIEKWTGQNSFGESTYGTSIIHAARIEPAVIRTDGESGVLLSVLKVILSEYVQVDPRDRITLPAAYGSRNSAGVFEAPTSNLIQVKYLEDTSGPICTVLMCGRL